MDNYGIMKITKEGRTLVGKTDNIYGYMCQVQKKYPEYKYLSDVQIDTIDKNLGIKYGKYLILDDFCFYLIEKTTTINRGYIYNKYEVNVVVDVKFNFIPINLDDDDNNKENTTVDVLEPPNEQTIDPEIFNKFQTEKLNNIHNALIIGKRNTGKTTLIIELIKYINYKNDYKLFIVSPTSKLDDTYSKHFDSETLELSYTYDSDKLNEFLLNDEKGIIILDDCLFSHSKWNTDPVIRELLFNARCHRKLLFMAMQFPINMKPDLRSTFDTIFTSNDYSSINQKKIYDHYGGAFPSFQMFQNVFLPLTQGFQFMVISRCNNGRDVADKVSYIDSVNINK